MRRNADRELNFRDGVSGGVGERAGIWFMVGPTVQVGRGNSATARPGPHGYRHCGRWGVSTLGDRGKGPGDHGREFLLYRGVVTGEYILVVEDDVRIGSSLLRALLGSGYEATWEQFGRAAVVSCEARRPDLVLLDLGLADVDGLDVCRQIHTGDPTIDIVMLTARDEELDVVVGLDAGAVDYIAKPFKLAELLARIRAQLRRIEQRPRPSSSMTIGDLVIDHEARQIWVGGVESVLRAKEFDLLARLATDAGKTVTREVLMSDVWDEHWFGSTKTLDFHVAALRRRIDRANGPSRISTVRGVGYRFELS